jgi:hypothetical protein
MLIRSGWPIGLGECTDYLHTQAGQPSHWITIVTMLTIAELPEFMRAADKLLTQAERQEKWLRLFEQQTPTFKWTPSGLQEVQSYPYGVTRGAPRIPFYAAATCFGSNS